jgi:hypothetical protein
MQTLLAHSAFWRGVALFAGMLMGKITLDTKRPSTLGYGGELVSWCGGARSRREDELARHRQTAFDEALPELQSQDQAALLSRSGIG